MLNLWEGGQVIYTIDPILPLLVLHNCADVSEYIRTWIVTFAPFALSVFTTEITVVEDEFVEDAEVITIFLSSEDPSVDVITPQEQIVFLDDDSEL